MSTQDTAALVQSVNKMTETVAGKMGEIDSKINQAKNSFDQWRGAVQAKDINAEANYKSVIDLTGLSTDYFYPVWFSMPGNREGETKITISRAYSDDASLNPFNDGDSHVAGLNLQLEGVGTPWNGDANFLAIKRLSQTYRKTVRQVRFGMLSIARHRDGGAFDLYNGYSDGQFVECATNSGMYLRGGLTYQVSKNFPDTVWYSRDSVEIVIAESQQGNWEISWRVKPLRIDDKQLGSDYEENRLAYMYDFDKRYVSKNDFSAQVALLQADIDTKS